MRGRSRERTAVAVGITPAPFLSKISGRVAEKASGVAFQGRGHVPHCQAPPAWS